MDIGGTGKVDGCLQQANAAAAARKMENLGKEAEGQNDIAGLREVAKQFEGVFMNTLMKAMRRTVPENELYNSGGATKFYQQMQDAEMARAMVTGHSQMGIADLIVNQFRENVDVHEPGRTQPEHPAPGPGPLPALDRYRSMGRVTGEAADRLRLRMHAQGAGPAVADTLQRFENQIMSSSARSGLDPALVLAVVMQESGGDPLARSPKGATGLMQLMPATANELGVRDSTSPSQNLQGGSRYLSDLLNRYEGDLDLALAAYNAGPGNVDAAGKNVPEFPETRNYVLRVKELYRQLGGTILATESPNSNMDRSQGVSP